VAPGGRVSVPLPRHLCIERSNMFTDEIIRYENGSLDHDESVALFQKLIDTGLAWRLQGHYGRTAQNLIELGLCHRLPTIAESDPLKVASKVQGY
jgi:hypothetical protein